MTGLLLFGSRLLGSPHETLVAKCERAFSALLDEAEGIAKDVGLSSEGKTRARTAAGAKLDPLIVELESAIARAHVQVERSRARLDAAVVRAMRDRDAAQATREMTLAILWAAADPPERARLVGAAVRAGDASHLIAIKRLLDLTPLPQDVAAQVHAERSEFVLAFQRAVAPREHTAWLVADEALATLIRGQGALRAGRQGVVSAGALRRSSGPAMALARQRDASEVAWREREAEIRDAWRTIVGAA